MFKNKLLSSSDKFVTNANEHCLVFTRNDAKSDLQVSGDDVWVIVMRDNKHLFKDLRKALVKTAGSKD